MESIPRTPAPRPVSPGEVARVLSLSNERARWHEREKTAFRWGYQAGVRAAWHEAFEAGYAACERDDTAERRALAGDLVNPGAGAGRRLMAATAWARREAIAHWDSFAAKAWATPAHARTEVQRAVVRAGIRGGGR